MRVIRLTIMIYLLITTALMPQVYSSPAAVFYLSSPTTEATVGQVINMYVVVNTTERIGALDLEIQYSSDILSVLSVKALPKGVIMQTNAKNGIIRVSMVSLSGFSSGKFLLIKFKAKNSGSANVRLKILEVATPEVQKLQFSTVNKVLNISINNNVAVSTSKLTIYSSPSGAEVYINETYRGTTPLSFSLTPGTYEVTLRMKDYDEYTTLITISSGQNHIIRVTLTPSFGYITVYSNVPKAEVYIDGLYIGNTPLKGYKVLYGRHSIKIFKVGYVEYVTSITISPGNKTVINARLNPLSSQTSTSANMTQDTSKNCTDSSSSIQTNASKNKDQETPTTSSPQSEGTSTTFPTQLSQTTSSTSSHVAAFSENSRIIISSKPSGASIYLNGKFIGKASLMIEAPPGVYNITAVLGNITLERRLKVEEKGNEYKVAFDFAGSTSKISHEDTRQEKRGVCGPALIIVVLLLVAVRFRNK